MNPKPMNHAELKLVLEQETAKLNELLQIADSLLIPVDVTVKKTTPISNDDVPVTKYIRTTIYRGKI
jgi:hypothetical protein